MALSKRLVFSILAAVAAVPTAVVAEDITVWSAVGFVMYGERTPLVGPTAPALTPLGAQQMYAQGSTLRNRYILNGKGNSSTSTRALLPIHGIESNALDTTQVTVLSTDDSYVAAGAQAFLQGLYPPQEGEFAYDNGGRDAAVLANGALVNFPLSGYQYPLVATHSLQDPMSSWLAGNVECSAYQESAIDFREDVNVKNVYDNTLGFYQGLWPTLFQGVFSESMANFYFAYHLFDYAAYQYSHDPQAANTLNASDLDTLRLFASTQQLDLNANLSVSSGNADGSDDMIRAIAGRMLAQQVVTLLRQNMLEAGANNKLALMFGSFEPFLSFFALSGLLNGGSASDFRTLPGNGAIMLFELYSLGSDEDGNASYPRIDDLHVRFLYRPDTEATTELTQYGLFTESGAQINMTYTSFANSMVAIGVKSVAAWCTMCSGVSVFCPGLLENAGYVSGGSGNNNSGSGSNSGSSTKKGMPPAVAGVIGALVTLCVAGLVVLAAMLFGGLRFFFAGRQGGNANSEVSNNGTVAKRFSFGNPFTGTSGFKGSERKTADADVAVSKAGVGHERVGSWELRSKMAAANAHANANADNAEAPTERVRSTILNRQPDEDDDEIMADLGRPVDPREHV